MILKVSTEYARSETLLMLRTLLATLYIYLCRSGCHIVRVARKSWTINLMVSRK